MEVTFTREDTKLAKGAAIFWMLLHHLWKYEGKIGQQLHSYVYAFDRTDLMLFGGFGGVCVAIFFFLGGYGLTKQKNAGGGYLDVYGRIKGLYLSYWKNFLVFIPLAFLYFHATGLATPFAATRYASFSPMELLDNLTGLSSSWNEEWWFLLDYVLAVLSLPLLLYITDSKSPAIDISKALFSYLLFDYVFPILGKVESLGTLENTWLFYHLIARHGAFSAFWMGIVFARHDLLSKLKAKLRKEGLTHPLTLGLILCAVIYVREYAIGPSLDSILTPLLCVVFAELCSKLGFIKRFVLLLGRNSTNMWLNHSFFCYYIYFFVSIVCSTSDPIISLATLIVLSLVASILVDKLWKWIGKLSACILAMKPGKGQV